MIDDRDKAGAVQAFDFCFELAWKMMKRILTSREQETGSPKDTFRKAALEKVMRTRLKTVRINAPSRSFCPMNSAHSSRALKNQVFLSASIIDDPELWFQFQEMRNLTSHTYEQKNLDAIVTIFDSFSTELEHVITGMQELA